MHWWDDVGISMIACCLLHDSLFTVTPLIDESVLSAAEQNCQSWSFCVGDSPRQSTAAMLFANSGAYNEMKLTESLA